MPQPPRAERRGNCNAINTPRCLLGCTGRDAPNQMREGRRRGEPHDARQCLASQARVLSNDVDHLPCIRPHAFHGFPQLPLNPRPRTCRYAALHDTLQHRDVPPPQHLRPGLRDAHGVNGKDAQPVLEVDGAPQSGLDRVQERVESLENVVETAPNPPIVVKERHADLRVGGTDRGSNFVHRFRCAEPRNAQPLDGPIPGHQLILCVRVLVTITNGRRAAEHQSCHRGDGLKRVARDAAGGLVNRVVESLDVHCKHAVVLRLRRRVILEVELSCPRVGLASSRHGSAHLPIANELALLLNILAQHDRDRHLQEDARAAGGSDCHTALPFRDAVPQEGEQCIDEGILRDTAQPAHDHAEHVQDGFHVVLALVEHREEPPSVPTPCVGRARQPGLQVCANLFDGELHGLRQGGRGRAGVKVISLRPGGGEIVALELLHAQHRRLPKPGLLGDRPPSLADLALLEMLDDAEDALNVRLFDLLGLRCLDRLRLCPRLCFLEKLDKLFLILGIFNIQCGLQNFALGARHDDFPHDQLLGDHVAA